MKKYNSAITLADDKNHMVDLLKTSLNRLITEIQVTQKVRDLIVVMMNILSYSEDEVRKAFESKEKKKGFMNMFK